MPWRGLESKIGANLTHNRGKLEAVTGKTATEDEAGMVRMVVDDEVPIRSQAIGAGLAGAKNGGGTRHPVLSRPNDGVDVATLAYFAIKVGHVGAGAERMERGLYAITEIGKAVERRGQNLSVEKKSRETTDSVVVSRRGEPGLHVALHSDR